MNIKFIIIGIIIIAALGLFFFFVTKSDAAIGTLNIYEGGVSIVSDSDTKSGETGTEIKEGDLLKTNTDSRVSIMLKDGSVVRLEAGSKVKIERLKYSNGQIDDAVFVLESGKMWSKVEPLGQGNWQVETPVIVASVRGTQFNTRYSDNSSGISVYNGKVGVALKEDVDDEKIVSAKYKFTLNDNSVRTDFESGPVPLEENVSDDWFIFNIGEDKKMSGGSDSESKMTDGENESSEEKTTQQSIESTPQESAPSTYTPPSVVSKTTIKTERSISSVKIFGNKTTLYVGEETKIKVNAYYNDGFVEEVPFEKIIWKKGKLGNIFFPGYFSSGSAGTVDIQAEVLGVLSQTVTITVKSSSTQSINPNAPVEKTLLRIAVSFTKNVDQSATYYVPPTANFKAVGYYSDNTTQDITTSVEWSVVSGNGYGSIDAKGLYTSESQGSDTVRATYQNISGEAIINIP